MPQEANRQLKKQPKIKITHFYFQILFFKKALFKHHLFIFTLVSHGIEFKGISQNTHSFGSQITFTSLIIFKTNCQYL